MVQDQAVICCVIPVFNDWSSFALLLSDINRVFAGKDARIDLVVVDDGSTEAPSQLPSDLPRAQPLRSFRMVRLRANVGHQAAIAAALHHLTETANFDALLVMDSDGEDRASDALRLVDAWRLNKESIIVARRTKRSESLIFQWLYRLYLLLFRTFTGRSIAFGNFVVIPASLLGRVLSRPELSYHFAATLLRTRLPILGVPTSRGNRFAGSSSMNTPLLVLHAVSAFSVFSDILFARLLITAAVLVLFSAGGIVIAVLLRIFTDLAIPGWTTTVVGVLGIFAVQMLLLIFCTGFLLITSRAIMLSTTLQAGSLIESSRQVRVQED